jgi:hypothetical protein
MITIILTEKESRNKKCYSSSVVKKELGTSLMMATENLSEKEG